MGAAGTPFLLVGAQRSGTTVLARLLRRHPQLYVTIDGKLLYYLITWILRDPVSLAALHPRLDEIAHALRRKSVKGSADPGISAMAAALETTAFDLFATEDRASYVGDLWTDMYRKAAGDARLLGDKYNEYLLQLPEIAAVRPCFKIVFICRHPVAAAASMKKRFAGRPWAPRTLAQALAKWAVWNKCWLEHRSLFPADRRLEFKYEWVVQNPEAAARKLCEFLQVDDAQGFGESFRSELGSDRNSAYRDALEEARRSAGRAPVLEDVAARLGYRPFHPDGTLEPVNAAP